MSNFKKNLLSIYGVNLINGFAGIAFIPLALKGLGPEMYGLYSIFTLMTSYIYFIEMGVSKYFIRSLAQENDIESQKKQMQTAVGVYSKITLILLLITPILLYIVPNFIFPIEGSNQIIIIIVIFAIVDYFLSIPVAILLLYNTGNEKFLSISKYNLISGLSRHLFMIVGVLIFDSLIIVLTIVTIRGLFEIFYAFKYLDPLPRGAWLPIYEKGKFKEIIGQSIFLSAAQLSQVTVIMLGTYLVNKNFSLRDLGIYKSAFDLSNKVWFFSNGLGLVIFPRFSALNAVKEKRIELLSNLIKYNHISWIIFNLLFIFSIALLPLLSNIFIIENELLFTWLLLGVCINAHSNLSYEFLQADKKLKEIIIMNIIVLLIIYFGFYLMVDSLGLLAIAISWFISQFLYSFILDFIVFKNIKIQISLSVSGMNLLIFIVSFSAYLFFGK